MKVGLHEGRQGWAWGDEMELVDIGKGMVQRVEERSCEEKQDNMMGLVEAGRKREGLK